MIIESSAPCRISLFGGGTDVGGYAQKYGGVVLNFAINIRQRIVYDTDFAGIRYPDGGSPKFYKTLMEWGDLKGGIYAHFDGEIRGGLGSSAAAAVALVGIVNKFHNHNWSKSEIAQKAWDVEVNKLGLFGGKQDQYASAYGGVNVMEFGDVVRVTALEKSFVQPLLPFLVLFETGVKRKISNPQDNLKKLDKKQIKVFDGVKANAVKAIELLSQQHIAEVGKLMDQNWEDKKRSNPDMTNGEIDTIYKRGKELGAWGGKLCGAGGGGAVLFITPRPQKLIDGIGLKQIDFDISQDGLSVRRI